MSDTDGKSLEWLVSLIEGYLAPSGFTVETRKRVYEDGVQIAELDIIITGKVGTGTFTGLIECRDRPSEGAAPASWIEQLVGRRDRFNLSSVMAVSTTGFAPGAARYAAEGGIELRTLQGLTYEAFQHWLPLYSPLLVCDAPQITAVRFFLKPSLDRPDLGPWPRPVMPNEATFLNTDTGEWVCTNQIWDDVAKETPLFDAVVPDDPPVTRTVIASEAVTTRYLIQIDDYQCLIERWEFDVLLHSYHPRSPLILAATYSAEHADTSGNETFATVARWQGTDDDIVKELILIAIPKDGKVPCNRTDSHMPPSSSD